MKNQERRTKVKNKLISLALLGSLFAGGCSIQKIPSDPNDPTFPAYVQQSENEIRTYTTVATGLYVLSQDDKAKVAKKAYDVAEAVNQAVQTELSLQDLRALAVQLILQGE